MRTVVPFLLLSMSNVALATLPPEVEAAKAEVIAISQANITNWGDPTIQAQLDVQVEILADYFAANRPADEVDLTIGPWRAIWYEDGTLASGDPFGIINSDVNNSYQIVADGFYYNVGAIELNLGFTTIRGTSFLKGEYTIANTPDASNTGERGLNVIDLEFVDNSIKFGRLPTWIPLTRIVDFVERGFGLGVSVPGPIGVTGELYNLYIDEDVRIAFGDNDTGSDVGNGLYVLVRQEFATN